MSNHSHERVAEPFRTMRNRRSRTMPVEDRTAQAIPIVLATANQFRLDIRQAPSLSRLDQLRERLRCCVAAFISLENEVMEASDQMS